MAFKDAIREVKIEESGIVDWREAKLYQSSGEDNVSWSGYIILTSDKIIFVSEKGFLKPVKIRYEIGISSIRRVSKIPLLGHFMISANTAEKGSGLLKRVFSSKNAQLSVKDGKTFFERLKTLNPEIKI